MWIKKIIAYMSAITGITALVLSTSKGLSKQVKVMRSGKAAGSSWWAQQRSLQGDLTAMAYLDRITKFCEPKNHIFEKPMEGEGKIDLYLYGDSYTMDIPKEAFANIDTLVFHYRYDDRGYQLNPAKKNILIIEASERFVRERFRSAALLSNLRINKPDSTAIAAAGTTAQKTAGNKPFLIADLFNPHINQNLEYHLFNYSFLVAPRQLKAVLNYKLFNRASGDVAISDDGKYLFYKMTVQQNNLCSSYDCLARNEVSTIVASLNVIYDYYKQAGFDEVYFSPVPNPASILQPGPYNNLIPLIQNNSELKMSVIDIYSNFKQVKDPAKLYRAGDTHWNNNGLQLWLRLVNDILKKESKRNTPI